MNGETVNVVLGCFGLRQGNFISCPSVENVILKVDESLSNYEAITDYFDNCRLFDRPMFDANAIRHFIFNLRDRYQLPTRPLWLESEFRLYEKFIINHRLCGLFLKLTLDSHEVEAEVSDSGMRGVFIKASDSSNVEESDDRPHRPLLRLYKR